MMDMKSIVLFTCVNIYLLYKLATSTTVWATWLLNLRSLSKLSDTNWNFRLQSILRWYWLVINTFAQSIDIIRLLASTFQQSSHPWVSTLDWHLWDPHRTHLSVVYGGKARNLCAGCVLYCGRSSIKPDDVDKIIFLNKCDLYYCHILVPIFFFPMRLVGYQNWKWSQVANQVVIDTIRYQAYCNHHSYRKETRSSIAKP